MFRFFKSFNYILRIFKIGFVLARHDALFPLKTLKILPFITITAKLFVLKKHRQKDFETIFDYQGHCLREALLDLGPSFVKLGQILSVRSDVVGDEVARALAILQDNAPGFPFKKVEQKIELSFQKKVHDLFVDFEEESVAAASIAQVHKAYLPTGEKVAVKVLRPGIRQKFRKDIDLLRWLVKIIDRKFPQFDWLQLKDTVNTIEDILFREIDLKMEAAAAEELAENFAEDPTYSPPKIYWDYSSSEVLTLEWVDGVRINDKQGMIDLGLDPTKILRQSAESFFYQIYRDGYFHADVHGGNAFVTKEGTIIPIDFGVMGRIDTNIRLFLAETLIGLLEGDYRRVAEVHLRSGFLPKDTSLEEFTQACRAVGATIYGKSSSEISYGELLGQMLNVTERYKLRVPQQLLLLQKTMVMAEGMGKILDKDANMWELARPLVREFWKKNMSPQAKILRKAHDAYHEIKALPHFPNFIHHLDNIVTKDGIKLAPQEDSTSKKTQSSNQNILYVMIFLLGFLMSKLF